MKRFAVIACLAWAALVLARSAHAQEYDDPAVAVCQHDVFQGQKPPLSFKRTKAEIAGMTVHLEFETSVLNTKPKKIAYSCDFTASDGKYYLNDLPKSQEVSDCLVLMESSPAKVQAVKGNAVETARLVKSLKNCQSIVKPHADRETTRAVYLLNLLLAGVYPIAPADTELKP